MKTKLLCIALFSFILSQAQNFQKNYEFTGQGIYHDVNIEPAKDGTLDIFMSGNLFDPAMQLSATFVKRIDTNGNIIWSNILQVTSAGFQEARIFDITTHLDMVIITGSVNHNGTKKAFAARLNAANGNLFGAKFYEIVSTNFNSTALTISYTEADYDNDGNPNPGYVIGGFFSNSFALDTSAMNIGFVIRTNGALTPLWTIEIDNSNGGNNQDYNMVNRVIETPTGYFITGGANDPATGQQSVLAHKVDFAGNFLWDKSYVKGNALDVSVDAYYDGSNNQIYMLSNYSITHQFGVTAFDDATGTINASQSYYFTNPELDHYGFKIEYDPADPVNNLNIIGYDRSENWTDPSGNAYSSQSNVFVFSFEKATGNQVGKAYQYLVPNIENPGDEYNFWNGQKPLIFYPDMSYVNADVWMYHVGYKTDPSSNLTQATLFYTQPDKENTCDRIDFNFTPIPLTKTDTPVISGSTPNQDASLVVTNYVYSPATTDCTSVLAVEDINTIEGSYLYPNPAQEIIYTTAQNASKYIIYDALGRAVSQGMIPSNKAIGLENLKKGLYFIKVINMENKSQTFKILKQ